VILGDDNDNAQTSFGRDIVYGEDGKDYILAGPITGDASRDDQDYVEGGNGRDIILGGLDGDILHAGNENDHLLPATAESAEFGDWVDGGAGMDTVYGGSASDFLQGGASVDMLHGGAGNDVILGDGEIRQTIRLSQLPGSSQTNFWEARGSSLFAISGVSVPYVSPASFAWSVAYGTNRDVFALLLEVGQSFSNSQRSSVNGGSDTIHGGAGDDWIAGQKGGDILDGGNGDDVLYGDDVDPLPEGDEGDDTLIAGEGADRLFGGGGDDRLLATESDEAQDVLYGGEGNDELRGGTGGDRLYGEAGNDRLYAGMDDSRLYGGDDADELYANVGDDHLEGGNGNDRFHGSLGTDDYLGGAGADTFSFQSILLGVSTIKDAGAEDRLDLDGAAFEETAFIAESESRWHSENGHFVLTLDGGTLTIQPLAGTGKIVVENYTPGVLGIVLPGFENPGDDNHAPTVAASAANLRVLEDEILNLEVPSSLFTDPDGDSLNVLPIHLRIGMNGISEVPWRFRMQGWEPLAYETWMVV
jgi:Ca2+-binding RTX toxin-like protein